MSNYSLCTSDEPLAKWIRGVGKLEPQRWEVWTMSVDVVPIVAATPYEPLATRFLPGP